LIKFFPNSKSIPGLTLGGNNSNALHAASEAALEGLLFSYSSFESFSVTA